MADLALDLGTRRPVIHFPVRVGLPSSGPRERRLETIDGDRATAARASALLGECAPSTVLAEEGSPTAVGVWGTRLGSDCYRHPVRTRHRPVHQVDGKSVLRVQAAQANWSLGLALRVDVRVFQKRLEFARPVLRIGIDSHAIFLGAITLGILIRNIVVQCGGTRRPLVVALP